MTGQQLLDFLQSLTPEQLEHEVWLEDSVGDVTPLVDTYLKSSAQLAFDTAHPDCIMLEGAG